MHPKVRNNSAFGYSGAIVRIHHGILAHMAMVHEDCGNFLVRLLSFLFLLTIVFLLSFSQPPRGMSKQKNSFTLFGPKQPFNPDSARISNVGPCSQTLSVYVSGAAAGPTRTGSDPSIQETRNRATISSSIQASS